MNEVKVSFDRETLKMQCEELRALLQLKKETEARIEEIKEKLESRPGDWMEFGIKKTTYTSKGSTDWKAAVESLCDEGHMLMLQEYYRKPDRKIVKYGVY